jgi:rSAM/selenodomain-associated transferase 1
VAAKNCLIVFVKAPRPGSVKTRLAQSVGNEAACEIYEHLLKTILYTLTALPAVELRYSPDDALAEITSWLQQGWSARSQGDGDLGARMERAFGDAFHSGASKAVIIGSDCPMIRSEDLEQAWRALDDSDLVLGPATDGGYWLVGLRKPHPALFEGIEWSSERVLAQTISRAAALNLRSYLLRELSDVDTLADWQRYKGMIGTGKITGL